MDKISLYHGSREMVDKPRFGMGNRHNDYGQGFYCTEHPEIANEWAASELSGGVANHYELKLTGLKILDLTSKEWSILNWLSLLLANRRPALSNPISKAGQAYLLENFSLPTEDHDLIIGYRADDSYFSFARAFLNNTITLEQLKRSMILGKLGEQYVLKSRKAFDNLTFIDGEKVHHPYYYILRKIRDMEARMDYDILLQKADIDGLYLRDIIKEGIRNDDPRLF